MDDLRETFDRHDRDRSGSIEIAELEPLLATLGLGRTDEAALVALAHLRQADPARVTWDELRAWWEQWGAPAARRPAGRVRREAPAARATPRKPVPMVELRTVFDAFDRDRSGELELRELAALLEALGQEPDDDEVAASMRELDRDGSGRVSWDEFQTWWDARDA